MNSIQDSDERVDAFGEHRLAKDVINVPPERSAIETIQKTHSYRGWEAVEEAKDLGLLPSDVHHAELSPTFACPEDCGGCPDRKSLHLNDPAEDRLPDEAWLNVVDRLGDMGVEYFMLIGGTIDRQPVTPQLMKYIQDKGDGKDAGWFTDGIMLQTPHTGAPTKLLERLVGEGNMLMMTTHVSADYLVPEGTAQDGAILDPHKRWGNEYGGSRYYKSAFGERLARRLVDLRARRVVLNTAISAHNIDQVLLIYQYASQLQEYAESISSNTVVLYTLSPWVWRPHLSRGDDPRNYDAATLLRPEHTRQLERISEALVSDTERRLAEGRPRVTANSRGYLDGLTFIGVSQDVPYEGGRTSELSVQPDGTVRMDPIFISARMLLVARSPYGYRDRARVNNPFDRFAKGPIFPNLIQTTRKSNVAWR